MNGYVMETRQVTKTYGSFLALDHVNIHVRKGCIYGLVGDNGAGKSTLLKLLAGQSFPTKGEIEILGKHGQKDLENVRKQMGCMIEQPGFFPQYDRGTDLEILLYPERDTGQRTDPGNDEDDGDL